MNSVNKQPQQIYGFVLVKDSTKTSLYGMVIRPSPQKPVIFLHSDYATPNMVSQIRHSDNSTIFRGLQMKFQDVKKKIIMSNRRRNATPLNEGGPPTSRPRMENNILNNNNNSTNSINLTNATNATNSNNSTNSNTNAIDINAIIAAERARADFVNIPPAAKMINKIDPITQMTCVNYLFCGWRGSFTFDTITGLVLFSHRGATARRSFDRADVRLQIGRGSDAQIVAIYAYDSCAAILSRANVDDIICLTTLAVIDQAGDKSKWNGSVPFCLRFSRASSLQVVIAGPNNNNGTNNNNDLANAQEINNNNAVIGNRNNYNNNNNCLPIGGNYNAGIGNGDGNNNTGFSGIAGCSGGAIRQI